jgi:hypothetical protein
MDIQGEEPRRRGLGHQALRHRALGEADLERRRLVDTCVGAAPDSAGDLDRVVAREPKEHVHQVRAEMEQRAASSFS